MKAVIFGNTCRKEVALFTHDLMVALAEHKVEMLMERDFFMFLRDCGFDMSRFVSEKNFIDYRDYDADFAFVVGGDGTFIHGAAKLGNRNIPMIGVNAGRLGFLTDIDGSHIEEVIANLLSGQYTVMERPLLKLSTEQKVYTDFNYALNEVAITKQDTASLITIHTWVDDLYLTSYQADGLLISTATGSTAYSLSVGGPIMMPNVPGIIIIPVAPHSLTLRPLIIPETSRIQLQVESRNNRFLIALDGRPNVFDESVGLSIRKSARTVKTVRLNSTHFFDTLHSKLHWGSDNRKFLKKGYDDPVDDND
ncbi:MAG: NAD kinase [Paludibacteraceae bacterium]|nr:NAD kinase [Candidatus Physcocola equi]MCQ2233419.1 NAD kinase [Paludibacteraceae bacterium]